MSTSKVYVEESLSRGMFSTDSNRPFGGDFGSFLESDIVEFVVGTGGGCKSYRVHSAFVTGQSPTLCNCIKANRHEDRVILDFIEPEIFLSFIEYTMRGMYVLPTRTTTKIYVPTERSNESGSVTKNVRIKTTFASIMTHCKIYTFATEYGISNLASMASRYLNGSLEIAERYCDASEASDLINVISYIYEHNITGAYKSVASICAKNIIALSQQDEFRQLVTAGGIFAMYLVDSLSDLVRRCDTALDTVSKQNTAPRPPRAEPPEKVTASTRTNKGGELSSPSRRMLTHHRRASAVSFTSGSDISEGVSSHFTTAGSNWSTTSNSESGSTVQATSN